MLRHEIPIRRIEDLIFEPSNEGSQSQTEVRGFMAQCALVETWERVPDLDVLGNVVCSLVIMTAHAGRYLTNILSDASGYERSRG